MVNLLKYRSKAIYYVPLLLILLMIYRNSWLPFGVKTLPGKENYIAVFSSLLLFLLLFDFDSLLKQNFFFHLNYNIILFVLVSIFAVSTLIFNSQEITASNNHRIRFLTQIFYFVLYFLIFPKFLFQNPDYFMKFVKFIIILGTFFGFTALLFLFTGINPDGTYKLYAVSIVWHPNYTAFIFTVSIFATIYFYFSQELTFFEKFFLFFTFVLQNIALILTFCRAAVIGVFFGYAVFLFIRYRWKLVLLIPLIPILLNLLLEKFFLAKGTASTLSRFLLVIPAYNMIRASWTRFLWGYGITNSFDAFKVYRDKFGVIENVNNPHNAYLSAIIEFGAFFSGIFILFLAFVIYKLFKKSLNAKTNGEKYFFGFLLTSIIALLGHSIFDSQLLMPEFFCMQFFLIYLGISHYYILNKKEVLGIRNIWDDI